MKISIRRLGLSLSTGMLLAMPAVLGLNALDAVMQPFSGFDLSGFYASYASIIDFTIYLVLFLGLAKATLGKRFTGRAGSLLITALALILAVSLSIYSHSVGFNLASFGPLAAVMLLCVAGVFMYSLVRNLGMARTSSASLAFLVAYFLVRAIAPAVYTWLLANAAIIPALLSIGAILSLVRVLIELFSHFGPSAGKLEKQVREKSKAWVEEHVPEQDFQEEAAAIEEGVSGIAERVYREEMDLMANLREMAKAIETQGADPGNASELAGKLREMLPKEHNLLKELQRLREFDQALLNHDLKNEKLFERAAREYAKVPGELRAGLRKELLAERKKLGVEGKIAELEQKAQSLLETLGYAIEQAAGALEAGEPGKALEWVLSGVKKEKQAASLLGEIRGMSRSLKRLVRKQVAQAQVMKGAARR